jgi:hypothetical protein
MCPEPMQLLPVDQDGSETGPMTYFTKVPVSRPLPRGETRQSPGVEGVNPKSLRNKDTPTFF